jgi:hypothetical protein
MSMLKSATITEIKNNIAYYIRNNLLPLMIRRRKEAVCVIIPVDMWKEYQDLKHRDTAPVIGHSVNLVSTPYGTVTPELKKLERGCPICGMNNFKETGTCKICLNCGETIGGCG